MRTWADGGDAAAGCGWWPGPQAPPVERVADPTLWCSLVVGISESPEEGRCQGVRVAGQPRACPGQPGSKLTLVSVSGVIGARRL